jgi:hypothetical protein
MGVAERSIRVVVEIDATEQPIRARLAGPSGEEREYVGWLALIAALEGLCAGDGARRDGERTG